jgi:hypothetical protein
MPDELNRLVENIAYGVERVVVAIGSRKDDDSNFHALAAPGGVVGISILTQRVHRIHEPAEFVSVGVFCLYCAIFSRRFFYRPMRTPAPAVFSTPSQFCLAVVREQFPIRPPEHSR